jgi:hypothetical protein
MFHNFFPPKNHTVYNVKKYGIARQAIHDDIIWFMRMHTIGLRLPTHTQNM